MDHVKKGRKVVCDKGFELLLKIESTKNGVVRGKKKNVIQVKNIKMDMAIF